MLNIAQVSDFHIAEDNDLPRQNLVKVIEQIKQKKIDLIIFTGDVVFKGGIKAYQIAKDILDSAKLKYFIVPGNHGDINILTEVFNLKELVQDGEIFYKQVIEGKVFLYRPSWRLINISENHIKTEIIYS